MIPLIFDEKNVNRYVKVEMTMFCRFQRITNEKQSYLLVYSLNEKKTHINGLLVEMLSHVFSIFFETFK